MRQWYAVYSRPRQEARAAEHLVRQGFDVFYPKLKILRQRKGGLTPVIESLFPRYLFIHLDDYDQNWAPIRSTRGVVEIVRSGGRPLPVPEQIIEQLYASISEGSGCVDITGASDFRPGEQVQLVDSPFKGNYAEFCARKGEDRVLVLLKIMHTAQQVELPANAIARM